MNIILALSTLLATADEILQQRIDAEHAGIINVDSEHERSQLVTAMNTATALLDEMVKDQTVYMTPPRMA